MGYKGVVGCLAVVIIVAMVGWAVQRRRQQRRPPARVADRQVELIDLETFERITRSFADWEELGGRDGCYLNPNRKTYTMCDVMTCASCGEKIPRPPTEMDGLAFMQTYVCPKCGKKAFSLE